MKVAVFGKQITEDSRESVENLYRLLKESGTQITVSVHLAEFVKEHCDLELDFDIFRDRFEMVAQEPDFVLTLGGDGTILDAATWVRDSQIPILGINTGRLGFLANVAKDKIPQAIDALNKGNFAIKERTMLQLHSDDGVQLDPNFALNELTVSRKATTSMITIKVFINGEFLNAYWADGLIIATPTGSTGYSLSCGGPIIMPGSENFVITPIAPHNLNVRPFVIPNNYSITLRIETREKEYLTSLDSRIHTFPGTTTLTVQRAPYKLRLVETDIQDFPTTLRNKLLWGLDRRN
ncbi:MAG: NAD kinase [Bacteroidota bacterium]|nr:NAD kinase [Bacteroidota bacterium]MDX5448280.1 NAD kinase [Bacteroidota bacterium]